MAIVPATAFGIGERLIGFASALEFNARGARADIRVVASRQPSKGALDRLLVSILGDTEATALQAFAVLRHPVYRDADSFHSPVEE